MRSTDDSRPKIGRSPALGKTQKQPARESSARQGPGSAAPALPAPEARKTGLAAIKKAPASKPVRSLGTPLAPTKAWGLKRKKGRGDDSARFDTHSEDDVDWDKVISIFKFLLLPALFAVLIVLVGVKLPKVVLYGVAAVIGVAAMARSQKDPEILLALMLLYIPFAHLYAISIAPMVNGTNVFILICLFTGILVANRQRQAAFEAKPGFKLIITWFVLSSISVLTLLRTPGALTYTLGNELTQYTAWLSQAGFYLAVYSLVKTRGQAKRAMIYIMFGTVIVVMFGLRELIEKMGLGSMEKSRVGGVFEQPNDFGGFIAYTFIPFIALFLFNINKIKAWIMLPYFLITLKVLITTFSRGAYVAFFAGALIIGWLRGKFFLLGWGILALILVIMFPQVLPESVLDRMNNTGQNSRVKKLDKSSEDRLILWEAAIEMTLESPVTGKGFKAFPYLKNQYTKHPVREGDPHNMYLYISSQMGIPALLVFLAFMAHMAWMGLMVFKKADDEFERVIGASIVAVVPCIAFINLFGSRMVGMGYVGYFYTMAVIIQVLYAPLVGAKKRAYSAALAQADTSNILAETPAENESSVHNAVNPSRGLPSTAEALESKGGLLQKKKIGSIPLGSPRSRW